MAIDPGGNARNQLMQKERRRQAAVISEFQKIQTRLTSEILDILDRIDKERRFDGNAPPSLILKKARLDLLLDAVTGELADASKKLAAISTGAQVEAVGIAKLEAQRIPQTEVGLGFFDSPATRALIGIAGDGKPLAVHFAGLAAPIRNAMFEALFYGIAAGTPNAAIAKEIRDAIGGGAARAMTITRTETNRAYREATRQFYDDSPDVIGWLWLAALDLRTCPLCWALHGRIFKTKTKFGTHPNCRCTMIAVFADSEKVPTGPEVFAGLTEAQQKTILGPGRLSLYNQGAKLSDFVEQNKSTFGIGRNVKPLYRTAFRRRNLPPVLPPVLPPTLPRPFPKSVVVNADGTLREMFHGSAIRIGEFDLAKVRASDLDAPFNGFWFTDNIANASPAMRDPEFIHRVHLNITNPIRRDELNDLLQAEPALRKLSHSQLRIELERRGFDGVKWTYRPTIDAAKLAKDGQIDFVGVAGERRRLVLDPRGGLDLYKLDANGRHPDYQTGYLDLKDFLNTEYDEDIFVAFRPDQIKILGVGAPGQSITPAPALPVLPPPFNAAVIREQFVIDAQKARPAKFGDALKQAAAEYQEATKIYWRMQSDDPGKAAAGAVLDRAKSIRDKLALQSKEFPANDRALLTVKNPIKLELRVDAPDSRMKTNRERQARVLATAAEYNKLVDEKGWTGRKDLKVIHSTKRAAHFAYTRHIEINADSESGRRTIVHEISHSLEVSSPQNLRASNAFLNYRTPGEKPVKLKNLLPGHGYGAAEVARPDKFSTPYVGKLYGEVGNQRATEVISMGVEALYADPLKFALEDPEYFDFILHIVRGEPWAVPK